MGAPTHLTNINSEFLPSKGKAGTKTGAETEGKANQRLPALPRGPSHLLRQPLISPPFNISDMHKNIMDKNVQNKEWEFGLFLSVIS